MGILKYVVVSFLVMSICTNLQSQCNSEEQNVIGVSVCEGSSANITSTGCTPNSCIPPCHFDAMSCIVTVTFNGTHEYISDLQQWYLIGPNGCDTLLLHQHSGPGVCNTGNDFSGLVFTNGANDGPLNICSQATPLSGVWSISGTLSGLGSCDINEAGWSVQVFDCIGADDGTITNVSISFVCPECNGGIPVNYAFSGISPLNENSCSHETAPIVITHPVDLLLAFPEINWYDSPTGGISLGTGSTFNPGILPAGQYTFYANCECPTLNDFCGGIRTPVSYVVHDTSDVFIAISICEGTVITDSIIGVVSSAGVYSENFINSNGCPQHYTLELKTIEVDAILDPTNATYFVDCPDSPAEVNGGINSTATLQPGGENLSNDLTFEWLLDNSLYQVDPLLLTIVPGNYSFIASYNNNGEVCTHTAFISVNYVALEPEEPIVDYPVSGCLGDTIKFELLTFSPDFDVLWETTENLLVVGLDTLRELEVLLNFLGIHEVCVTVTNPICPILTEQFCFEVQVNDQLPITIVGNDKFCDLGSTQLTAQSGAFNPTFEWSNGLSTNSISVNTPGTYEVTVTDNLGCSGSSSISVVLFESPNIQLVPFNFLCTDSDPVQLRASPSNGVWTSVVPGLLDGNAVFDPTLVTTSGIYQFIYTFTENGCDYTDTLNIEVSADTIDCAENINETELVNIITPLENSNATLQLSEIPIENSEIQIFNRWGQEIFYTKNYQNDWSADGYPGGVYFYIFTANGNTYKQTLTVIK